LHMDYIFMGKAEAGQSYILMLKDDFSSYARLVPCRAADAESTIDALLEWFATFGVVPLWVSDRGSHFKNSVVQGVNSALKAQHHFTTAYSPWANGTVERLGREVLRATRALLSELKLRPDQWTFVHRMVQSALNNSPSKRLGGVAPVTAMTGLKADSPARFIVMDNELRVITLEQSMVLRLLAMEELQAARDEMHKLVKQSNASQRGKARSRYNAKTHVHSPNFDVGDFVLLAKREFSRGDKLTLRWRGPYRVLQALSDWVFNVEDLITGKCVDVHSSRLRFYHDASLTLDAELIEHIAHNEKGYPVECLLELKYSREDKRFMALVSWLGFPQEESTWEPLISLHEDVPEKVEAFLSRHKDRSLVSKARSSLIT
jgi:Integrase core domain/Chromo (CHRromatin Organisation MOdifier) domain